MLPEFLLTGAGYHELAFGMLRVTTGMFFAISGYHKLTNAERHKGLVETLKADRIPFIRFNEWFVPTMELVAGTALAAGILSVPSALILGAICLVAACTDGYKRVMEEYKPIDAADFVDDVLYLPEVLLGLMLTAVILGGPGAWSVDSMLLK